jgi:septum formation protein
VSLWRGEPLILASKSEARRGLLAAAGIPVIVDPADLDERSVEASKADAGTGPEAIALLLAREKALAVARRRVGFVLGADQTLALGPRRFAKPVSLAAAREQLAALAGKTHSLHSAIAVADGHKIVFETVETARLTMRPLSQAFLGPYLADAGERATASVGAYQLESLGVHLFERVEGDHFTILGLPLLPLLAFFRKAGLVVP